jgi:hypothetical protein
MKSQREFSRRITCERCINSSPGHQTLPTRSTLAPTTNRNTISNKALRIFMRAIRVLV